MLRRFSCMVLLVLCAGCATTPPDLEVYLLEVAPVEATVLEQRIRLDIRVQNAGETELSVTGLTVQLDVNDRRLAKGVSNESFTVPRLGEVKTSIEASVTLFDVARLLLDLPGRESFAYAVKGKVFLAGALPRRVRFEREGQLQRRDLESLAAGSMRSGISPNTE